MPGIGMSHGQGMRLDPHLKCFIFLKYNWSGLNTFAKLFQIQIFGRDGIPSARNFFQSEAKFSLVLIFEFEISLLYLKKDYYGNRHSRLIEI